MSSPDKTAGQSSYWNSNIDPHNLGRETEVSIEREMAFYFTPDQQWALSKFAPLDGKLILEIGAGLGVNAIYLASKGARVVASDIAHERLVALKKLVGAHPVHPVKCAAEHLPFRNDAFDHHYSKSVLIHTQIADATGELKRTLKPGGRAVFIEPLTGNPLVNLYRATAAPKIWKQITHYFTEKDVRAMLAAFRTGEEKRFYLLSFPAFVWQFHFRSPKLFWLSLRSLGLMDRLLQRIPGTGRFAWFSAMCVEK